MRHAHASAGRPPLRRYPRGFEGLARIVVGQQLSASAASTIFTRLSALPGGVTPALFLDGSTEALRAAGLSRPKITTLAGLAREIDAGRLDLSGPSPDESTGDQNDDSICDLRRRLLTQRGIGPWTVDIYEMFCLGRADAFAPGDLALQEAVRRAFGLETRPGAKAILEHAEAWRPVRSVAAALLWAYYATGEGKRVG